MDMQGRGKEAAVALDAYFVFPVSHQRPLRGGTLTSKVKASRTLVFMNVSAV